MEHMPPNHHHHFGITLTFTHHCIKGIALDFILTFHASCEAARGLPRVGFHTKSQTNVRSNACNHCGSEGCSCKRRRRNSWQTVKPAIMIENMQVMVNKGPFKGQQSGSSALRTARVRRATAIYLIRKDPRSSKLSILHIALYEPLFPKSVGSEIVQHRPNPQML